MLLRLGRHRRAPRVRLDRLRLTAPLRVRDDADASQHDDGDCSFHVGPRFPVAGEANVAPPGEVDYAGLHHAGFTGEGAKARTTVGIDDIPKYPHGLSRSTRLLPSQSPQ